MLTVKQELFCNHIVDGCTQTEAYRRAYNCENMDDKTICNEGYKLTNNRDIAARIQQLRDQLAERLLFPRIERLTALKKIAIQGEKDGDKINAIKVFSEMIGDNAPQKVELDNAITIKGGLPDEPITDSGVVISEW